MKTAKVIEAIEGNKELSDLVAKKAKELLDLVAADLPFYPPLTIDEKTVSVKDMLPLLTPEELDYVYSKYKGRMPKE